MAGLACCLLLALLLSGCSKGGELPECFDAEEVKAAAKQAVSYVHSEDYEAFRDMFAEEYQEDITEELFAKIIEDVGKSGEFKEFGNIAVFGQTDKETGENYAGAILIAEYENGRMEYRIGFMEGMKLIQFYI